MIELIPKVKLSIIEETLERIGIADLKNKIIYPSCYLYKDIDSKYYICHFKELFEIRNSKQSYSNMTDEDFLRLNSICMLLEDWGMVDLIDFPDEVDTIYVKTIPYREKKYWKIKQKFNIGSIL